MKEEINRKYTMFNKIIAKRVGRTILTAKKEKVQGWLSNNKKK